MEKIVEAINDDIVEAINSGDLQSLLGLPGNLHEPLAKMIAAKIAAETESKVRVIRAESQSSPVPFFYDEEFRELLQHHVSEIKALNSLESIDEWLRNYRRLSLIEWLESL